MRAYMFDASSPGRTPSVTFSLRGSVPPLENKTEQQEERKVRDIQTQRGGSRGVKEAPT